MDQNLYFRFSVPPWAGILAALGMNTVLGGDWTTKLSLSEPSNALIGVVGLLFASPTAGYLLGTLVVGFCHWFEQGPEYEQALKDFGATLCRVAKHTRHENPRSIATALDNITASGAVAHFEYLLDKPELLAWRRRQRAAYYAGWTTTLSIAVGVFTGALGALHLWSGQKGWSIVFVIGVALFFGAVAAYNAIKSGKNATEQQAFSLYNLTRNGMRHVLRAQAACASIDPKEKGD